MKTFLILYCFFSTADTALIQQFKEFRTAIYTKDITKVKSFIDFPIRNENNEIWDLVFMGNEKQKPTTGNAGKPFTEKDFDKYFDRIFSKRFIQTLQKIKSAQLFTTGDTQTETISDGKSTNYYMSGHYDKTEKTFDLGLQSKTHYKDEDDGEFSIIYQFKILPNGQLKFVQVRLAG